MNKKYFETKSGSLEEISTKIATEQPSITKQEPNVKLERKTYFENKPGSLEDVAAKVVSESKLDPVNKDAVKKKFDDRKDKDIDNDGDTDSTDKYLHKKRKAISKATSEDKDPCWKDYEMIGMKKKDGKEVPNCVPKKEDTKKSFEKLRTETKLVRLGEKGKTATGQKAAVIDLEPRANPV